MKPHAQQWPDPTTGLTVTRLCEQPANHPYFTNPGWYDNGRRVLLAADFDEVTELVALDLDNGRARRLTDLPPPGADPCHISVDAAHGRAAIQVDRGIEILDLGDGRRRRCYQAPDGWALSMHNWTADGAAICFSVGEDPGLPFDARFAAHPRHTVCRYDVARDTCRVVHDRAAWLGHVNTAPDEPDLLSFCHEGPWTRVEHRVWCLRLSTGAAWKVGPALTAPACVGHEYWLADGRRIAYHGYDEAAQPVIGIVDVHDGQRWQVVQPVKTKHSHSLDGVVFVGDGSEKLPWILAWRRHDTELDGPFLVCHHGGGWSQQRRHVHPRLEPDGRGVVFTSDAGGAPHVYRVDLPERLEELPRAPV